VGLLFSLEQYKLFVTCRLSASHRHKLLTRCHPQQLIPEVTNDGNGSYGDKAEVRRDADSANTVENAPSATSASSCNDSCWSSNSGLKSLAGASTEGELLLKKG
jgi:hypothetical protein